MFVAVGWGVNDERFGLGRNGVGGTFLCGDERGGTENPENEGNERAVES